MVRLRRLCLLGDWPAVSRYGENADVVCGGRGREIEAIVGYDDVGKLS
jgi:hypothetical protein